MAVRRHLSQVRGRPTPGALVLAIATLAGCGSAPVQPAEPAPGTLAPTPDAAPVRTPAPSLITPVGGRAERQVRWRLAARAGHSLLLDVNVGGPPCDAVTAVEVDETPASIVITVHAGRTPGADCRAGTPALLGTYRVKARLREPQAARKLVDGARG